MKQVRTGFVGLLAAVALMFTMFTACNSVPTLTPHEQEAAAITTITSLRKLGDELVVAGKLTPDEAQSVQNQLNTARAFLNAARVLPTGSAGILTDLQQASSLLTSLSTYLNNAKAGDPK